MMPEDFITAFLSSMSTCLHRHAVDVVIVVRRSSSFPSSLPSKSVYHTRSAQLLHHLPHRNQIHTINLPDAVTLGGAYNGAGTSPVDRGLRDLLQWAVGLQKPRWCRLFMQKAEVAVIGGREAECVSAISCRMAV